MAGQAGNPVSNTIAPHVISGAFVQQYYHILHEQPEQVHKFYQDSSILGRPDSSGTMVSVTTLGDINEKIMSMDFRNCLTEIETADAQLSHKDGVLIVVTGSLTSDEGVCRRFTQSFFLAPQESGGYFVLNDVFRFITERKTAEINQAVSQENESGQCVRSVSETFSVLPEPTLVDKSVISDHARVENSATESPSVDGAAAESNVIAEPPVQVAKEEPPKAPVAPASPPAPTQKDAPRKSYASIVKVMKESPPSPPVTKATPSVAKHKPTPKPVTKAVEDQEKTSAKPAQANETIQSDGIVAENNSSFNERGYSVFVKGLPFNSNVEIVEEEFKKFGAIKPGGVQVRHNKADRFCFGFVEYESQNSMRAAIEASPVRMGEKEVYVEEKRTTTRVVNGVVIPRGDNGGGVRFQSGRGLYRGDNFRGRGAYMSNTNYRGGENFDHRNDGENFNRRNDGDNFNRRNDGKNFNRRSDGENFNRRHGNDNFNHGDIMENFHHRGDKENFNRRNDFNRQNLSSGRGQGPPPRNGYHHSGNGFHPSRPFQNGNGRFPRGNGLKQSPVAA